MNRIMFVEELNLKYSKLEMIVQRYKWLGPKNILKKVREVKTQSKILKLPMDLKLENWNQRMEPNI